MLTVGLTGGSGSGKGYLSKLLSKQGIRIIDTDSVYHEMISKPGECTAALENLFGSQIIGKNGGIERAKLAKIVFSDKGKLKRLNEITHRFILASVRDTIACSDAKIVVIDAPQLFEAGFDAECDVTVAVIASNETRIARITKRDNITSEAAIARISNQNTNDFYRKNCDYILTNEDSDDIEAQALELGAELVRLYENKEN